VRKLRIADCGLRNLPAVVAVFQSEIRNPKSAILFFLSLWLFSPPLPAGAASTAADTWGAVPKSIAIHPGTTTSVWKDVSRSQITNGAATCTPVGDGTYEYIVGLTRGQTYNYIFYATSPYPAVGGLTAYNEYYDIMPTSGRIRCSTNGITYNDTTSAYYGPVTYDARRILTVPTALNPGETLWVFNNFGETPGVVSGIAAAAEGETQIRVSWTGVYGFWGQNGESFKAADVLAGGSYEIYRGNTESGPFSLIAIIPGQSLSYLDTNLTLGDTKYYAVFARDAYNGTSSTDTFPRLKGDTSTIVNARASGAIRTFFIVRDPNWDYIERTGGVAYFSRPEDPPWGNKTPVSVVRVYLPPQRSALLPE
jgi:hypothetical protein